MDFVFRIETVRNLDREIILQEQLGAIGTAHLLRASKVGRICLWPITSSSSAAKFKRFALATQHRPSVVLVGDDDGQDRGPKGFPLAQRAVAWSRFILLHSAAAELFHYEIAIRAAARHGRALVVECCSATLPAWEHLVRSAPHQPATLTVIPGDQPHPQPMAREKMQ